MLRAPLLAIALPLIGGILAERLLGRESLFIAVLACPAALVAGRHLRRAGPVGAAALALTFGILCGALRGHPVMIERSTAPATYAGLVTSVPRASSFETLFELTLDDGLRLDASVARGPLTPHAGERVVVRGAIEPFDLPRNPGEPSGRDLAAERGVAGRLVHGSILNAEPAAAGDPRTWFPRLREWAAGELRSRVGEPYATILAGAMWGERGALPGDLRNEFQETGTVHILVTAGLHLGVVAALCAALLTWLGVARVPAAIASIAVVWAYALASGAHLPSQRAATMITIALLAHACGARIRSWNAYAAALIVVALAWPASVGGVSFALSFSCVGAILLFAEPIAALLRQARVPHVAGEALALTCATQIGVWPLTASTFLIFAPYAPLANLLVVPVVGVAMTLGFALLATARAGPLSSAFAHLDAWVLWWIVEVVHHVAALPRANIVMTPPPPWTIAVYDLAMAGAGLLVAGKRPRAAVLAIVAAATLVAFAPAPAPRGLTITMLDVGQGDAIVVRTPSGHVVMFDTGGRLERGTTAEGTSPAEEVGERIVVPALIRMGIKRIDVLIITHPHGDHVGGCAPILRTLTVAEIVDSGQRYSGHAYLDCMHEAAARQVPVVVAPTHQVMRFSEGVSVTFLAPDQPYFADGDNDVNENSIVAMLQYRPTKCDRRSTESSYCTRPFRALFTGDAGAQSEQRLLASGGDLEADVLKVGHHGSAYSSTPAFIQAVRPQIALISVGRHNVFGHPAPETITTLAALGTTVYRSDRDGAITLTVDQTILDRTMIDARSREAVEQ